VFQQDGFDFCWEHVFAATDDHVLGSPGDVQVPRSIHVAGTIDAAKLRGVNAQIESGSARGETELEGFLKRTTISDSRDANWKAGPR